MVIYFSWPFLKYVLGKSRARDNNHWHAGQLAANGSLLHFLCLNVDLIPY